MKKPTDFGSTTAVYARFNLGWLPLWLRGRITPMTLWFAVGTLASGIAYVGKAQWNIDRHQESITDLQHERELDRDLMQRISTQLAAMSSKVDNIADEVDRQRAWRERIEDVAETSSRPRRRK